MERHGVDPTLFVSYGNFFKEINSEATLALHKEAQKVRVSEIKAKYQARSFGRSDVVGLLDFVKYLREDHRSQVRLATLKPSLAKYSNDVAPQVRELRFLREASEHGAKIYFCSDEGDIRKIMHPKFLLTSLGVVFGSFNFTKAGRYGHIEDGNYSSALSPVYFEKKQRIDDIVGKCKEATLDKIKELLFEFERQT